MKPEFQIGQVVTFKPYEKPCKCVVKGIQIGWRGDGRDMQGNEDSRVFYKLAGEAVSLTTGKSIMDSELFEAWTGVLT